MSVRCDKRGRWFFRKWVRHLDGRRERIAGYPKINTKKAAETAEHRKILEIENPSLVRVQVEPAPEVPTVAEFSRTFLSGYAGAHKPSEKASKRQILDAYILPWFGAMPVDSILQSDVDAFVADLLGGKRERKTVNNVTSVLSSLLRYAAKNRKRPPVDLGFAIDADESELVALESEEVDALLAAADARYAAAILLAADAGLRIGEIRAIEWAEVDELRRTVSVIRSIDPRRNVTAPKNRRRRVIPQTDRLRRALAAVPRSGRHVFGRRDGKGAIGYWTTLEQLHALYQVAGVKAPPKPWHCLRHTFCTELARRGVPMHVIAELAGHESLETTRRYTHATENDRREAIAALEGNGQQVGSRDQNKGT